MENSQSWNQSIPIMPVTAQNEKKQPDSNKVDIDKDIERIKNAYQFEFSRAREKQLENS